MGRRIRAIYNGYLNTVKYHEYNAVDNVINAQGRTLQISTQWFLSFV